MPTAFMVAGNDAVPWTLWERGPWGPRQRRLSATFWASTAVSVHLHAVCLVRTSGRPTTGPRATSDARQQVSTAGW